MVEVSNILAKPSLSISKSPSSSFLQSSSSGAPLAGASHCRRPEPLGRQQQHPGREGGRAAPPGCQQQHPGREWAASSCGWHTAREEGGAEERRQTQAPATAQHATCLARRDSLASPALLALAVAGPQNEP